jgi:hypothetical protein
MKLDRNENTGPIEGCGKYALINMRRLNELYAGHSTFSQLAPGLQAAFTKLEAEGLIQYGAVGDKDEFFVIKLKDRHAHPALLAYADSIRATDPEFADEVDDLARRAGELSPWCKEPD